MKIFISHATADGTFVNSLVDHIQINLNLKGNDFFNSSARDIRNGDKWLNVIKETLDQSDLVLAVVTPSFLESSYCLIELGASWIKGMKVIPILIPPCNDRSLKDTPFNFAITQMEALDSESKVRRLLIDIKDQLKSENYNLELDDHREEKRTGSFVEKDLKPFINNIKNRNVLDKQTLVQKTKTLNEKLSELEEINDALEEENKRLGKMKDAEEVEEMDKEFSDIWDTFNDFAENIKKDLDKLCSITPSVIFHIQKSGYSFSNNELNTQELKVAENEGEIYYDEDSGYALEYDHPVIRRINQDLDDFKCFILNYQEGLEELYRSEHGEDKIFGLDYKGFWKKVFKVRRIEDSSH